MLKFMKNKQNKIPHSIQLLNNTHVRNNIILDKKFKEEGNEFVVSIYEYLPLTSTTESVMYTYVTIFKKDDEIVYINSRISKYKEVCKQGIWDLIGYAFDQMKFLDECTNVTDKHNNGYIRYTDGCCRSIEPLKEDI